MTNLDKTALNPEEFVEVVAAALPHSTAIEGWRLLEHARAWATVSYPEQMPRTLDERLTELEAQWQLQMK